MAENQDNAAPDGNSRYEISVVANALDLLLALADRGALSMSEVMEVLQVSRSAAYRLLVTLEQRRFVARVRRKHKWGLGPAFLSVSSAGQGSSLRELALDGMERLLEEEQETVNLAEFDGTYATYIEILESPLPLRMRDTVGQRVPLSTTALGKSILAAMPGGQRKLALEGLDSANNREALETVLAQVRERGWALEQGETQPGVACVGAAILGSDGLPVGGLSVSLPEARLGPGRAERIGSRLVDEARQISASLRGSPVA